jgi:endoglucanase
MMVKTTTIRCSFKRLAAAIGTPTWTATVPRSIHQQAQPAVFLASLKVAYAARMKGSISKAQVVFAGMGANFTDPKGPYDGSKYGGISFWAKKSPETTPKVRFKIPDAATDPDGGICSACYNDFGIDLKLTEEWTQYVILWDMLKQERGWGAPHPHGLDPAQMFAAQWQVNDKGQKYDIWVDDVAFTGCQGGSGAAAPAPSAAPAAPAAAPAAPPAAAPAK